MDLNGRPGSTALPGKTFGPKTAAVKSTGNEYVDREIDKVSQAVSDAGDKNETAQGRIIYDVRLAALTPTQIDHGLGSKPRSWTVCGQRNMAVLWQVGEADAKTITLCATGVLVCDIRIW